MQTIMKHIKEGTFVNVYLLCGEEEYLKKTYKDRLHKALLGDGDGMNDTYFEGKSVDEKQVFEVAQTLPFFSERRVIVLENTGFFKRANEMAEYIKKMPDTTYMIFVEREVDKRSRLYKYVKDKGYISQMDGMDEKQLLMWVAAYLDRSGKKIKTNTARYLVEYVGSDMNILSCEMEKVIAYMGDREEVLETDVEAVCVPHITGKIFQMLDAVATGNKDAALKMYYELLALREKPMSILFLLTRHFNILLQVKELLKNGLAGKEIAGKVGVPPFAVNKYSTQCRKFTRDKLLHNLKHCVETEERIKTGRMTEQIGVEVLLVSSID